jgi:hypothetical protein
MQRHVSYELKTMGATLLDSIVVLSPHGADIRKFLSLAAGEPVEPITPFDDARVAALGALSQAMLRDSVLRADAACVALAYWLRPANLHRLKNQFTQRQASDSMRVPVGRVLHFAPANVETLFVYSWALSFVCGNANIVRVSSRVSDDDLVMRIARVINDVMRDQPALRDTNLFVSYAHDRAINELLSSWCDHRVIWGGDETAAGLRTVPLGSHASERVFGTKFSYSMIVADAYLQLADDARHALSERFYNDMFWFDQMACSSPQVVFWVGAADAVNRAVPLFDAALDVIARTKHYAPTASDAVRRLNVAFERAASSATEVDLSHTPFLSLRLHERAQLERVICGGGLITHVRADHVTQVAAFADVQDQTVTHFGFEEARLRQFALHARGVDRVVPIGEALTFDAIWDGFDLLGDFTRAVVVR